MRNRRGYLDLLLEDARPARAAWAPRQPDWGPTRLHGPAADEEPVAAPTSPLRRSARRTGTRPNAALPEPARPVRPVPPATPEPTAPAAPPLRVVTGPGPAAVRVRAEQPTVAAARHDRPSPPHPSPPDAPTPRSDTGPARAPAVEPQPARDLTTPDHRAALDRLDELSRRFGTMLPPVQASPSPVVPPPAPAPSAAERREPVAVVPVLSEPTRPQPQAGPRLEIGSIEVFVTAPPAPAPLAPVPAVVPVAPVPAAAGNAGPTPRLSRPLPGYGFGQG